MIDSLASEMRRAHWEVKVVLNVDGGDTGARARAAEWCRIEVLQ
jgi:hypothetical protein